MLINNSTRILNDSWDRDKWKTIATTIGKKKAVINVLILTGLERDGGAGSCNTLEQVRERGTAGSSAQLASVEREREKKPFPIACPCSCFASCGSWHICGCICSSNVWCHAPAIPCFLSVGVPPSGCHQSLQVFMVRLLSLSHRSQHPPASCCALSTNSLRHWRYRGKYM